MAIATRILPGILGRINLFSGNTRPFRTKQVLGLSDVARRCATGEFHVPKPCAFCPRVHGRWIHAIGRAGERKAAKRHCDWRTQDAQGREERAKRDAGDSRAWGRKGKVLFSVSGHRLTSSCANSSSDHTIAQIRSPTARRTISRRLTERHVSKRTFFTRSGCMSRVIASIFLIMLTSVSASGGAKERPLRVFVLAGTSNMLGAAAKIEKLPDDLRQPLKEVLVYKNGEWTPLEAGKNLVGNEATFGRAIAKHLSEPVGIIWISVASASNKSPGPGINNIVKQSRDKGRPIVIAGILLDVS